MEAGRTSAAGAERGLADPRLQDVLVARVLRELAAAFLAHLRATCSGLHILLDSGLSCAAWQSAYEQLQSGWRPAKTEQHEDAKSPFRDQQHPGHSRAPPGCRHQQINIQEESAALSTKSFATLHQSTHQPDQQNPAAIAPAAATSDALHQPSSVGVQQQLWGNMQRKLREGGEVMLRPLKANVLMRSATWSPCGQWVALEQMLPCSRLVVWDTESNFAQESPTLPHGCVLKVAWLPARAWLLYIEAHTIMYRYRRQSIFCHNLASGGKQNLLNMPHCLGHRSPVIAPSGHLMAYVHIAYVVLQLPSLRRFGTLHPEAPTRSHVAAMSVNPAATQLAVCWEANMLGTDFCLDLFDIVTKSRIFSLPCHSSVKATWAPTSTHLLISGEAGVSLLNMSSLYLISLPVNATAWFPAFKLQDVHWSAKGDLALVRGTSDCLKATSPQLDALSLCFAIRPDGAIAQHWTTRFHETAGGLADVSICPSKRSFCVLGDPAAQHALDAEIFWGTGVPPREFVKFSLSRCGCLAVTLPSRELWIRHVAIDASGLITRVLHLRLWGVEIGCAFAWHPAHALSCVYAVAGQQHDLWLVDGRAHRILRHWSGIVLLASRQASAQTASSPNHSSWTFISWSEDGTKLCMMCPCTVLVIDLQSDSGHHKGQVLTSSGKVAGFKTVWKALQQRFLHNGQHMTP